jgi:hypothetical protein
VDQSSDDASLNIRGTFAVCGVCVVLVVPVADPPPEPPPQALSSAAVTLAASSRDVALCMIFHSRS